VERGREWAGEGDRRVVVVVVMMAIRGTRWVANVTRGGGGGWGR
jgi:hypothetical protein